MVEKVNELPGNLIGAEESKIFRVQGCQVSQNLRGPESREKGKNRKVSLIV